MIAGITGGKALPEGIADLARRWQEAFDHIAEARRFAEQTQNRWAHAETLRLRGEVLVATGDSAAAETSYREAIAIAQQQSAKFWELRTAMSLARLWRDQDKRVQAICWHRSTAGSPRASAPRFCRTRRRY
jgi:hypothetical protein